MGITATSTGKGYLLLPVIITILILALVALDFHTDNHFLAAYRETNKVTNTETVLDQLAMTALGTYFFTLFCFNMQDNCITFVFLTSAFVVV